MSPQIIHLELATFSYGKVINLDSGSTYVCFMKNTTLSHELERLDVSGRSLYLFVFLLPAGIRSK